MLKLKAAQERRLPTSSYTNEDGRGARRVGNLRNSAAPRTVKRVLTQENEPTSLRGVGIVYKDKGDDLAERDVEEKIGKGNRKK